MDARYIFLILELSIPPLALAAAHDLSAWIQFGVLGLVVAALVITKQLVPGYLHRSIVADLKREVKELKLERRQLLERIFEHHKATIPALGEATKAVEEALETVRTRGK